MTVYKVPVTVKKIKTFLKNALVFDMEFYFGHIIIHTYVRTSLYVCITIWEYTCTNMFSDAGKTYFGIPYIFASNLTLVFAFFIFSSDTFFVVANKDKIKKAIFPDSQSFVNLKSNTMKNTVQIYEFLRWVQILRKKKSLL